MPTPITLKIKFKSATLEQFIERYSIDVSRGGIFIRTKQPLPVGSVLRFEFQLTDGAPLIGGEGTVVWVREFDPSRSSAPGMGVRFDKLAAHSGAVLDSILAEKDRRGEAQTESRFEAGMRDAQNAAGTSESERDAKTPLPSPLPGLSRVTANTASDFGTDDATRVMQPDQAEALLAETRTPAHRSATPPPPPPRRSPVVAVPGARSESFVDPLASEPGAPPLSDEVPPHFHNSAEARSTVASSDSLVPPVETAADAAAPAPEIPPPLEEPPPVEAFEAATPPATETAFSVDAQNAQAASDAASAPADEPVAAPVDEASVAAPVDEASVAAPVDEASVVAPVDEAAVATSVDEAAVAAPVEAAAVASPIAIETAGADSAMPVATAQAETEAPAPGEPQAVHAAARETSEAASSAPESASAAATSATEAPVATHEPEATAPVGTPLSAAEIAAVAAAAAAFTEGSGEASPPPLEAKPAALTGGGDARPKAAEEIQAPVAKKPPAKKGGFPLWPAVLGVGALAFGGYLLYPAILGDGQATNKADVVMLPPPVTPAPQIAPPAPSVAPAPTNAPAAAPTAAPAAPVHPPAAAPAATAATAAAPAAATAPSAAAPVAVAPSAPPAPAAPAGVEIALASTPPGASVTVDGNPAGVTPTRATDLDPTHPHAVVFSLKGYKDARQTVTARAGATVATKLSENEHLVEVTSTPPGADVLLDGKKVGRTAAAPIKVKIATLAKAHKLVLHHTGFVDEERSIDSIAAFDTKDGKDVLTVAATLQPKADAPPPAPAEGSAVTPHAVAAPKPHAPRPVRPHAKARPAGDGASDAPSDGAAEPIKVPSWMKKPAPEGAAPAPATP